MTIIVLVSMGALLVYQGVMNYLDKRQWDKERQQLLDKLMSRNYENYTMGKSYLDAYQKDQLIDEMSARNTEPII